MTKQKFIFIPHTADVKFQAFGEDLEEQFTNSALALKETIAEGVKVKSKINKKISVEGNDEKSLLYNFLEEFLYLLDSEGFLLGGIKKVEIDKTNKKLTAEISGDKASNYKFTNSVKAVTYNDMIIDKGFVQVVLDV